MTSIVQQNCLGIERLTEKTWGRGWVVLVVNTKMAEHFTRFTNCWLKTKQKQWCDDLTDDFCCLENLQNWTFRYLLNLLINMRYRRWRWWGGGGSWHFWLVFKLKKYLERIMKQSSNSGFVSSEELWRSRGVLSSEAARPRLIWPTRLNLKCKATALDYFWPGFALYYPLLSF